MKRILRWARRGRHALRVSWLRHGLGVEVGKGCRIDRGAVFDFTRGGVIRLGKRVEVRQGAIISPYGGTIEIGDDVYIGPYSVVYGHGGLKIGAKTQIAAHCVLIPANHTFEGTEAAIRDQGLSSEGIEVGEDCWLGAGVKVLDGVKIGAGCVVGAGAVVTKSLPPGAVAVGVPARVTGMRGGNAGESVAT